ncbi:MAG: hypothetical protein JOZ77_05560 [Candidatus Eremiobacteraeota bacterium]|nr:hypothetical protein [Candidatus Eremiobacteraeota bacterium]
MKTRLGALAALLLLAACMQSSGPALPPASNAAASSSSCYVAKQNPTNAVATITFYGWPDNSPPGNQIAHPVIHKHAGGQGTYCDPTTFATERANDQQIPYGIKIYVPFIKQYFIREDLCASSGPKRGSGSNGCHKLWFDLWIGGTGASKPDAVIDCELKLTPGKKVPVILWPRNGLPVAHRGPIYGNSPPPNGSCDGKSST